MDNNNKNYVVETEFSLDDIIAEVKADSIPSSYDEKTSEKNHQNHQAKPSKTSKSRGKHAKNNPLIANTKDKLVKIINDSRNKAIIKILIFVTLTSVTIGTLTSIDSIENPDPILSEIVDTTEFDRIDEILANMEDQLNKNDICLLIINEIDTYLSQENLSEREKSEYLQSLLTNDKNSSSIKSSIVSSVMQELDLTGYIGVDYVPIADDMYQNLTGNEKLMQVIKEQSARFGIPEEILLGMSMCKTIPNPADPTQEESTIVTQNNIMNIDFASWDRFDELRSVTTVDDQERIMLKEFRYRDNTDIANNVEYAAAILRNCLAESDNQLLTEFSFSNNPDRPKDAFDYYFYKETPLSKLSESEMTELIEAKKRIINIAIKASGNLKTTIEYESVHLLHSGKIEKLPVVYNELETYVASYCDQIVDYMNQSLQVLDQSSGKNL